MSKDLDVKKIFGNNLKKLRESRKLTQEQLAEYLNLQTYQTVNRIENAKSFATAVLFEKICKFFNVEPYMLLLKQKQTYNEETIDDIKEINNKLDKIYDIVSRDRK